MPENFANLATDTQEMERWSSIQQNRVSAIEKHVTILETNDRLQLLYPKSTANSNSNEMDLRLAIVKALSAMNTKSQHETVESHRVWPEMMAVGC